MTAADVRAPSDSMSDQPSEAPRSKLVEDALACFGTTDPHAILKYVSDKPLSNRAPYVAPWLGCVAQRPPLEQDQLVPLPVFWTAEGDTDIATPSSIVDPEVSVRSRFIDHAAAIAMRAFAGVR